MSPTPRLAAALAVAAVLVIVLSPLVAGLVITALVAAFVADARMASGRVEVAREAPGILARGVAAPLSVTAAAAGGSVRLRQPVPPDIRVRPSEAVAALRAELVAGRRGRHVLPAVAVRREGPLGLARWDRRTGATTDVVVYPDLPAARRLAAAVRKGRFRDPGRLARGPLGLGTDFESLRDYTPDDDIRQVNWLATARAGRPISNRYRVDQDRDVVCVVDTGRLMAAPLGDRTRLDAAVDAVAAVALVADVVGDRCGCVAFAAGVRRRVRPVRAGGERVVQAVFDLEPEPVDSDYELAFRTVAGGKRSLVLVYTDLLEEAAARPLVAAVPVLARHHAVVVATVVDEDLDATLKTTPSRPADVYVAAVAAEVLAARSAVVRRIVAAGAVVIEAPAASLGAACVSAYLRAKARARL